MAFEFRVPDVGEGLTEAEIVEWRVAVGDVVSADQIVVDVETDKAVVEIPVPVGGTVLHLGGAEGETVEVGSVLLVVGEPDETWPPAGDSGGVTGAGSTADVAPIVGTLGSESTRLERPASGSDDAAGEGVRALPVVRKLARDLGVDLREVPGTGSDGRITRDDVTAAAERGPEPRVPDHTGGSPEPAVEDFGPAADEPRAPDHTGGSPEPRVPDHTGGSPEPRVSDHSGGPGDDGGRRELSRLRRTIAERMSRSWAEIPHVTAFEEVDATRLLEVRSALTKRTGTAIPLDALVVKAIVPALAAHPDFNARLDGDELVDSPAQHVGVAVDTPDGLMVVVVRNAGSRTLSDVAAEIGRLAEAARNRTATPEQLSGQTFTVSNIGALGGGYGTPIVPYGTIGILSVGRTVDRPVARNGRVTIAPIMPLSLSYDHRVIDGGAGRRFMAQVAENLAEPALFLAD